MTPAIQDILANAPREPQGAGLVRAKRVWALLLTIGFWFAHPYYLPMNAPEEKNADAHAIIEQSSLARQIALPLMGLLACYMLWRIPRRRRTQRFQGPLAIAAAAYLTLAVTTLAWTADPLLGLKRLTVFFLDVLLVMAVAKTFRAVELAKLGFFACGSVAVIALLVDVFLTHTFAPFDPDYRLLGVMSANSQGQNLTVFIFCGLTLLMKYPRRARSLAAALVGGAALLFFTRSRLASFSCLLLSLLFTKRIIDARYKAQNRLIAMLLVLAATIPGVIASGSEARLLQSSFMMGRTDTQNTASASNRTPLWGDVTDFIAERPFTGYGFHAFWTADHIDEISKHLGWVVPNAHNIYLDETLSAGIGGMLLYAFLLWGAIVVAWQRYRRNPGPETLFPLALLGWLFFSGWLESVALDPFLPTFLAYVSLAQCMLPESPYRRVVAPQAFAVPRRRRAEATAATALPQTFAPHRSPGETSS